MIGKIVIKRLTSSDLTFFEEQFRQTSGAKQKGLNLSKSILVKQLFPVLAQPAAMVKEYTVRLYLYGPGLNEEHRISRSIILEANIWRLNGEYVKGPDENPTRYNILSTNDIAIMEFNEGTEPGLLRIVFVASNEPQDAALYQALNKLVGVSRIDSMKLLPLSDLENAVLQPTVSRQHPMYELLLDADIEDIAVGGSQAREGIISRPTRRKISYTDLQKMKENASRVGLLGEQFVNDYFEKLEESGTLDSYEWVAKSDAVSPYDFWVSFDGTEKIYVDVKTTEGDFDRLIHASYSELRKMSTGLNRYDLYRVYGIDEKTAQLRIVKNVEAFAGSILSVTAQLPQGISADTFSFPPSLLDFGNEISLLLSDPTSDDEN